MGFLAPLLLPGPLSPTRYLPIGQGVVELILRCVPCEHQSVFRVVTDPHDASIVHLGYDADAATDVSLWRCGQIGSHVAKTGLRAP